MRSLLAIAGVISFALISQIDDGSNRCLKNSSASESTCHHTLNR